MTPNTGAPDADSTNAAENDAYYTSSLRNRKNKKNNMTPDTDSPDDNSPGVTDYDAASPNSLILDSSPKRKIGPKSMLKLKKIKIKVTDVNAASPNAINNSPHVPNATTAPDNPSTLRKIRHL